MPMGRPKADLVLSEDERAQLSSMVRSRSIPAALSMRARIVLAAADGAPNSEIAERLQLTRATAGKWRRRFIERRINGLYDELRPGKPRSIDDERVADLINKTLHTKPANGATHWSVRSIAAETAISPTSVHRYFKLLGLQPHRTESFKLSTDPFFIEKLRDVVGLYLNPPENALVLCVDEKSQCQALERTQPLLPMGFGYVEGVTHDYVRHGTTTLFAALNVLNGAVLAECKPRHRHQEFLAFLRSIDKAVPAELDVHCIVDNYASHKHPKVKAWLAARPRWHMHFIPTYSSWLNQVERFFSIITDKAIRRGSFASVKELVVKIDHFVTRYNQSCKPFMWTAT
ncbi:IS630 family transposase, partial [Ralstonia pseudosolanacearum]